MAAESDSSLNCKTFEEYQSDPRIACNYGAKCYQKNSVHVNKYKHPPKTNTGKAPFKKGTKRFKRGGRIAPNGPSRKDEHNNDSEEGNVSDGSSGTASPKRKKANAVSPRTNQKVDENAQSSSKDHSSLSEAVANAFKNEPELPPSPRSVKDNIKQKFLFDMPEDFYSFWDLCLILNPEHPTKAFNDVGLTLVGPYDVLSGHLHLDESKRKQSLFLLHWRYYYDPPGFQTVLKGDDNKQYHLGYFRDEPKSMPVFLASNCAAKDGEFSQVAENMFGAVNSILNDIKTSANPFLQSKVPKLQKVLQEHAKENDFTLDTKTQSMKQRDRHTVCKTFNRLGLVVPVEKKTEVGYRELIETNANLRRILHRIVKSERQEDKDKALDQLQQVITAANIANDECDFGTSVELGLDLFAYGSSELDQSALQLLSTGYSLLGHKEFAKIAQIHIQHRKKGVNLDAFAT